MIGRSAELAALAAAVSASNRRPVVLLGEEGIGKTTLLRAAAAMAAGQGFAVVRPGAPPRVGAGRPVAVIVDDAHAVAFSRPPDELLLAAATGPVAPQALGPDAVEILVPPLSEAEAAELVDVQPGAPVGRLRSGLLRACGGNPLGIVELAPVAGTSTLPESIRKIFADRLAALTAPTRHLLLYAAAAADEDRLSTVLAAAGTTVDVLAAAERAELVVVAGDRLRFRHPLARIACYLGASAGERRRAHRDLAAHLADASAAAQHLVGAADGPQEPLAALLEASADRAIVQQRYDEATGRLEQAALLSPDPERAAARLARAAQLASVSGDARWCRGLWDQVGRISADPDLRGRALIGGGFAGALSEPAGTIVPRVAELLGSGVRDRTVVLGLTAAAAGDVLINGREDLRARLSEIVAGVGLDAADEEPAIAAARAIISPGRPVPAVLREPGHGRSEEARLLTVAVISWLADEPADAVSAGRRGLDLLRARAATGSRPFTYVVFLEALLETASWREATAISVEAAEVAVTGHLTVMRRAVAAQTAVLRVRQGDLEAARAALSAGTASSDNPLVRCLTGRAAGELAAAEGDWDRATTQFRALFDDDGAPLHFAWSYRVVADLAAAAARSGRCDEAVTVLDHLRRVGALSPWQGVLLGRASALLGLDDDATVQNRFEAAAGPAAAGRPYEQAVARLQHADWLRGRRRLAQARSQLAASVETFRRIGSTGRCAAAREQLRAAGVAHASVDVDGFAALTAQQQLITRLAAQGLSNRQIADRLAVSPRTVGSHLYQIYPKLGVATRRQLADVIPGVS